MYNVHEANIILIFQFSMKRNILLWFSVASQHFFFYIYFFHVDTTSCCIIGCLLEVLYRFNIKGSCLWSLFSKCQSMWGCLCLTKFKIKNCFTFLYRKVLFGGSTNLYTQTFHVRQERCICFKNHTRKPNNKFSI